MSRSILLLAGASLLASCSQAPPPQALPPHPTAVTQKYVHNFGYKGDFASERTETLSVREDMQRTDEDFQFTGAVMSRLASARSQSSILRLDKNLAWSLANKDKQYTECPLTGCVAPGRGAAGAPAARPQPAGPPPARSSGESGRSACTTRVTKTNVTVQKTGQSRNINGFDTEEYQATWQTVLEDPQHRQDTSTLSLNVWTTAPNSQMQAVFDTQQAFGRALARKLQASRPPEIAAIPPEAMGVFSANFMSAMSEDDRRTLTNAAKQFEKIKGYAISTKLEWYLDAKACQEERPAAEKKDQGSSGGLVSGLVGSLIEKQSEKSAKESEGKPIFGYVEEVKVMKVEPVSDSVFLPPPDFKLVNRS